MARSYKAVVGGEIQKTFGWSIPGSSYGLGSNDENVEATYDLTQYATLPVGITPVWRVVASPAGVTIDQSGLLTKAASVPPYALYSATVALSQDFDGYAETQRAFTFHVNAAPVWSGDTPSNPTLTVGVPYDFGQYASDPDGDTLVFSLASTPANYSIDPATGVLTTTTGAVSQSITIQVSDGRLMSSVPVSVVLAGGTYLKWDPGFYTLVSGNARDTSNLYSAYDIGYSDSYITEIGAMPNMIGWEQRAYWSALEGTRGNYTNGFAWLDALLAKCQAVGKRLVLAIGWKTYGGTNTQHLPPYLATEPGAAGGWFVKPDGGVNAKEWNQAVMNRIIAMCQVYAARYDSHPWFAGLKTGETSGGNNLAPDYSHEVMRDMWLQWIPAMATAWVHTPIWHGSNYMGETELEEIIAACRQYGIGVTGPDVVPGTTGLDGTPVHTPTWTERIVRGETWNGSAWVSGGTDYRGQIPVFAEVQGPEMGGKEGCWSPQQFRDWAYSSMHAHNLSFLRKTFSFSAYPVKDLYWSNSVAAGFADAVSPPHIKDWVDASGTANPMRATFPTRYTALGKTPLTGGTPFLDEFTNDSLGTITADTTNWALNLNGGVVSIANTAPLGAGQEKYYVGRIVKASTLDAFRAERRLTTGSGTRPSYNGQSSLGYDMWYGLRMRCDQLDATGVEGYPLQWHDDPGGDNTNPCLAVKYNGATLSLLLSKVYTDAGALGADWTATVGSLAIGTVIDLMFRVRWCYRSNAQGGNGAVDLYVNDEITPRVQYRGSTAHAPPYTSGAVPFIKVGGYWSLFQYAAQGSVGDVVQHSYDQFRVQVQGGSRLGVKPQGTRT